MLHLLGFKKLTGVFVLCFFVTTIFCQTTKKIIINFKTVLGKNNLVLNDSVYNLKNTNTVIFKTLKFYTSNFELLQNNKIVFKEKNSFHLVTADSVNKNITLSVPSKLQFNTLKFNLGIDSLTNVSGALGGDLDATTGMYWTWQSGYINFKLEGKSNVCNNPKKEFQFHLGGYTNPLNALQNITLNVETKNITNVVFDVKQFIEEIDLSKQNHIMSPNSQAVTLSQQAAKCFKIE